MHKITYSIILLGGLIILLELFLRICYFEQLKTQSYPMIYKIDSLLGYSHIPYVTSRICIPSIDKEFTLNNHGFYGDDFSSSKDEGIFRIAIVGNSITEGIWLDGKVSYPIALQEMFFNNGFPNIEVINCSFGGVNKDIRNYKHVYHNVVNFDPDIVLLHTGIPFFNENEHRENYHNYLLRHSGTQESRELAIEGVERIKRMKIFTLIYDVSFIFRAYCKRFYERNICQFSEDIRIYREKASSAPDIMEYQFANNTSITLLKDLKNHLQNNNCKLIILDTGFHKFQQISMKKMSISYMSLNINWDESMSHKHDGHPNEKGQHVIANHIFQSFIDEGFMS